MSPELEKSAGSRPANGLSFTYRSGMFSICSTKKLADHLRVDLVSERSEATTKLGDWYANRVYIQPKQHVIFVNETTLLPVIVPLAPAKTLEARFVRQYGMVLRELGVDESSIVIESASMDTVTWAKTANRSVVGSMNEFIKFIEHWNRVGIEESVTELAVRLSSRPCRAGGPEVIWPDRETVNVFAGQRPAATTDTVGDIHQLKITLQSVKPSVWRRIQVPCNMTLKELSPVLEAAMGWMGGHLHSFQVGNDRYQPPDPDGFFDSPFFKTLDESTVTLGEVLPVENTAMQWSYDFGDGWEHDVLAERIDARDPKATYPLCQEGRRACPPEDCGGPWGYDELLEALADPSHERHDELSGWAPPDFDAAHFDPAEATEDMQSPRPLLDWY